MMTFKLARRPFHKRFRNYFRMYRNNGLPLWRAMRSAWRLARV